MKHAEILKKWIWENCHETIWLWYQCVAWAKKYYEEYGERLWWFWWSAINWWRYWYPFSKKWRKIGYTWSNAPSEWDVIFWSEGRCKDGHVAIANKFCNSFLLRYSDQNGTWREDKIQNRWWGYKHVLWWYTLNK